MTVASTVSKISSEKGLRSGEKHWAECATLTCGCCACSQLPGGVTLEHSCSSALDTVKVAGPRIFWGPRHCLWRSLIQISSASRNVLCFVLPLVSRVLGIKASFPGTEQCPLWSSGHVIPRTERLCASALFILQDELLEAAVIDPRPPLSTDLKLQRKVVRSKTIRKRVPVPDE